MTAAKIMDIISRLSGCDGQAADAVLAFTQVKMEDAHNLKNTKIGVSRHLDSSIPTQMAKVMVLYENPVVPPERNLYGHPFDRTIMGKAIWKILLKHGWEKIPNWECLFRTSCERIFHKCVCGWHKIDWKETKSWSDVETTQQRSRFGRPNIFPWPCKFGMHSKTMWNKQRYCRQLQNHVRIANFRCWNRKTAIPSTSSYFFMVLWHGWSCKEVCGTTWWVGKQDDSAILQSIYSMHRWPPLHRRRNKICWRIVKYMLSNCSEMLILGKNWTTWYSMKSK